MCGGGGEGGGNDPTHLDLLLGAKIISLCGDDDSLAVGLLPLGHDLAQGGEGRSIHLNVARAL